MSDKDKAAEWLEFDYLPRVGAYRKDCKIGCDACMPKHNGDNYCDIDMLGKILILLKEQVQKETPMTTEGITVVKVDGNDFYKGFCPTCQTLQYGIKSKYCDQCGQAVKWE